MKRQSVLALALALVLTLPSAPAHAVNFNDKCSKPLQTLKINGATAICTVLNGEKKWLPDSFQDLTKIWRSVSNEKKSSNPSTLALEITYSPTVNRKIADSIASGVKDAALFWQRTFILDRPFKVLFITEKDRNWFNAQQIAMELSEREIEFELKMFDNEVKRNGKLANAAGLTGGSPEKAYLLFYIGTGRKNPDVNSAKVAAHEYTHIGQMEISNRSNGEDVPCWTLEGGAEFYGKVLSAKNLSELKEMHREHVWGRYEKNFKVATEPKGGWAKFFEDNGPRTTDPDYGQTCGINGSYAAGALGTQYLYMKKGHAGMVEFFRTSTETKDYKSAILSVYGITWEEMKREIAQYIRLVVAQTPSS
jgi:hypothetical protein